MLGSILGTRYAEINDTTFTFKKSIMHTICFYWIICK